MATGKFNFGKIAIVLFLTALIWVWADLALDETPPPRRGRIIAADSSERIWVSFGQRPFVDIEVTLSGPHSAFNRLDSLLQEQQNNTRLEFVFDARSEQMNEEGVYPLRLLDFLQKDERLKRLGLKVKSVEPEVVMVNIVELVEKTLPVECFDEDGVQLKAESIVPSTVKMFVPQAARTARIELSRAEIETARSKVIERQPFVYLTADQRKAAAETVRIKLAVDESPLSEGTITEARLRICSSPGMLGKYRIEIENLSDVIGPIKIRATGPARDAYQAMPYHVILEVDEEDAGTEQQRKEVNYNFPPEYLRANEIELNQTPIEARFRLIPIPVPNP